MYAYIIFITEKVRNRVFYYAKHILNIMVIYDLVLINFK